MARIVLNAGRNEANAAFMDCDSGRSFWPDAFGCRSYWMDWWGGIGSNMVMEPMAIIEGGRVAAMIAVTDLRREHKTAELHYCGGTPKNSIAVYRRAEIVLDLLASDSRINVLYGHHHAADEIVTRTAKLFGFKQFAKVGGICYTAKEFKPR